MTVAEWGGRAMCPADEYADPALREEMAWHALEQALIDRWGRLDRVPDGRSITWTVWGAAPWLANAVPMEHSARVGDCWATWRASTDDHLGEDSSGLVDLTCTLTPA